MNKFFQNVIVYAIVTLFIFNTFLTISMFFHFYKPTPDGFEAYVSDYVISNKGNDTNVVIEITVVNLYDHDLKGIVHFFNNFPNYESYELNTFYIIEDSHHKFSTEYNLSEIPVNISINIDVGKREALMLKILP